MISVAVMLAACAADRRDAKSPESKPAADAAKQENAPSTPQAGYGGQPGAYPQQPAPPPPTPSTAASGQAQPGQPGPQMALSQASDDIDKAQRELDVAASNCQNACRALGSMDRAAGKVCTLTREDASHDRCDDAKRRLLTARDRVRNTCGGCPDNQPAVNRDAPIPSVH